MSKTKFTVDRSKWVCSRNISLKVAGGLYNNPSRLLNKRGNMCCVGFFAEQILEIPKEELFDIATLHKFNPNLDSKMSKTGIYTSNDLIEDDSDRESILIKKFASLGYELEFVGEYPNESNI